MRDTCALEAVVDLSGVAPEISPVQGRFAISELFSSLAYHWAGLRLALVDLLTLDDSHMVVLVALTGRDEGRRGGTAGDRLACLVTTRPASEVIVRSDVFGSLDEALASAGRRASPVRAPVAVGSA